MTEKEAISTRCRQSLSEARRIIIKVGTRVLANSSGRLEMRIMRSLVTQVAKLHAAGYEVIMVSSGAVGAGIEALGLEERPRCVPDLQMCAAVGQAKLMARYESLFAKTGTCIGQVLLTHSDFVDRIRLTNAARALEHLLAKGVVPIINENDVVADEELKSLLSLGDNDYLSALVTRLTHTHLLILLSTVDGLLATSPRGRRTRVSTIDDFTQAMALVRPQQAGSLSKGGMDSKLNAAKMVVESGVPVVIANGRHKDVLAQILAGEDVGTLMMPQLI